LAVAEVVWNQLPLFAGAPAEVAVPLRASGQLRQLRRREVALRQEEFGQWLVWVLRGRVQGVALTPDGREFAVASLGAGSHFGDGEAWGEAGNGLLQYVAITEAVVVLFPVAEVRAAANRWPTLWERLLKAALCREANWLRWRQWWSLPNAVERVVAVIRWLAEEGEEGLLPPGVTQQEIAGFANTTRETVTRVMQRLQQEGRLLRTAAGWRWQGQEKS